MILQIEMDFLNNLDKKSNSSHSKSINDMSQYTEDEAIIKRIQDGGESEMKILYQQKRAIFVNFLKSKYACKEIDALDIYQESMTVLWKNIKDGKLKPPLSSSLETYILAVGKRLAMKHYRDRYKQFAELKREANIEDVSQIDRYELEAQKTLVQQLLNQIGEGCQKLLDLFYKKGYATEAVMQTLALPSEGAVRKKKYECLKKLREMMGK